MLRKITFAFFLLLLLPRPFLSALAHPRQDIMASAALFVVSLLLVGKNIRIIHKHPVSTQIAVFLSGLFLSTFSSQNIDSTFSRFYQITTAISVFFAASYLSPQEKNKTVRWLMAGAIAVSLIALRWLLIGQFTTLDFIQRHRLPWPLAREYLTRGRAFAPFTLPNHLAGYLLLWLPVSLGYFMQKDKNIVSSLRIISGKNVFYLMSALTGSWVFIATQSLSAILSLGVAIFIFSVVEKKQHHDPSRIRPWACVILFLCALALIWITRAVHSTPPAQPLLSLTNRLSYWRHAVGVIASHPIAGVGLGNYPYFKAWSPHNAYLQAWAETGILGFFGLIGLAGAAWNSRPTPQEECENSIAAGLCIGGAAFLVHNLMESTLFVPEVSLFWWVTFALRLTPEKITASDLTTEAATLKNAIKIFDEGEPMPGR